MISDPQIAYRSCDHCRKYEYNEETGQAVVSIRTKELLPRRSEKTLPCVDDSCKKGHYSNPVELSPRDQQLLDLYHACRASGGAVLTEAERRDSIIMLMFSQLEQIYWKANVGEMAQLSAAIMLKAKNNG